MHQALSRPYTVAAAPFTDGDSSSEGDVLWAASRPRNVMVGMWRLGLLTRAHLDVVLEVRGRVY